MNAIGLHYPMNIDIDWLGRNIYVVDSFHILVCNLEVVFCTPILKDLKRPRAIKLDLKHRFMYWSDIHEHNIKRSGMDGSNIKTIVDRSNHKSGWFNAIALDLPASRLYWIEAQQDMIESSNLYGEDVKV